MTAINATLQSVSATTNDAGGDSEIAALLKQIDALIKKLSSVRGTSPIDTEQQVELIQQKIQALQARVAQIQARKAQQAQQAAEVRNSKLSAAKPAQKATRTSSLTAGNAIDKFV